MRKQKNCPKCGKPVEVRTFEGKGERSEYYYEERPLSEMEKKLQRRMGLPLRHLIKHTCK